MIDRLKYKPEEDQFREYRKAEFMPQIWDLLEKARQHRGCILIRENELDKILEMQAEDPERCELYIKYRFLGTAEYLDVYGKEAEKHFKQKKEANEMQKQIEQINVQLQQMNNTLQNMQNLLMTIGNIEANTLFQAMKTLGNISAAQNNTAENGEI